MENTENLEARGTCNLYVDHVEVAIGYLHFPNFSCPLIVGDSKRDRTELTSIFLPSPFKYNGETTLHVSFQLYACTALLCDHSWLLMQLRTCSQRSDNEVEEVLIRRKRHVNRARVSSHHPRRYARFGKKNMVEVKGTYPSSIGVPFTLQNVLRDWTSGDN